MSPPRDALTFPSPYRQQVDPYLPTPTGPFSPKPFVTLTYATSLDSHLSLAPGVQTLLSGPESKAMTHYLRSHHDAILIGAGTAVADDPSLNCRIEGTGGYGGDNLDGQPRPVVLDPMGRWDVREESKVVRLAREGRGRAPWVVVKGSTVVSEEKRVVLEGVGGRYLICEEESGGRMNWNKVLTLLSQENIGSVMVEGGGRVINDLLSPEYFRLVDTVIQTIAPTWLGRGGVQVCPGQKLGPNGPLPAGRLKDIKWVPLGEDVILCGRPQKN